VSAPGRPASPALPLTRRRAQALLLGAIAQPRLGRATPASGRSHVDWSEQSGIYEVNLRQFTPEGSLAAFERELPRLARMGVGILWLMPLQPIGVKQRKGSLGSYYAIRDYTAVNPEFGSLADLKRVLDRAHALGMKVILDWVANHTAWDHPWVTQHPDWYQRDADGRIHGYVYRATPTSEPESWEDVVGLDYRQQGLWRAMAEAMRFWLREVGFDGFRCDVAGRVPTAFWEFVRPQLDAVRPVFMLAESDKPELHARAFDMGYDWALYDTLKRVAQGKARARDLQAWWQQRQARYPGDAIGMNFTGNHDTNSWNGSDAEFYGSPACFKAMSVLSFTLPGMPLIYGGQEAYFEKRLKFFERDPIVWKDLPLAGFYAGMLALRRAHPALASGPQGGLMQFEPVENELVLAFTRERDGRKIAVAVNLSGQTQAYVGAAGHRQTLEAWAWQVAAE
jgi:glycosidase